MITVFTNGVFDLLHPGHLHVLEFARKLGDRLIVGVNSDESALMQAKSHPLIWEEKDRIYMVNSLRVVEAAIRFRENTPELMIRTIKPDILVKGVDWEGKEIAGAEFVKERGGAVVFCPLLVGWSTTNLIERIKKTTYA